MEGMGGEEGEEEKPTKKPQPQDNLKQHLS